MTAETEPELKGTPSLHGRSRERSERRGRRRSSQLAGLEKLVPEFAAWNFQTRHPDARRCKRGEDYRVFGEKWKDWDGDMVELALSELGCVGGMAVVDETSLNRERRMWLKRRFFGHPIRMPSE